MTKITQNPAAKLVKPIVLTYLQFQTEVCFRYWFVLMQ